MTFDALVYQGLIGVSLAMYLWLLAAGLTIAFGVLGVVNFAHGSLYMLGGYFAFTFYLTLQMNFWLSLLLAAVSGGVIGMIMERFFLRYIYHLDLAYQILLTFGFVLIFADAARIFWGGIPLIPPMPEILDSTVSIVGRPFPIYNLFVIFVGIAASALLWLLLDKTSWGETVRASASDREMASALGVNIPRLFTAVFSFAAMLAALSGALGTPVRAMTPGIGTSVIIDVFIVTVIGGLGNLAGAFVGALVIGLMKAYGVLLFPDADLFMTYLIMALVLLFRPKGLLGGRRAMNGWTTLTMAGQRTRLAAAAWAALAVALLTIPLFGDYVIWLTANMLILALFAVGFNLLFSFTGLLSFGQAGFFAVGGYVCALILLAVPSLLLGVIGGVVAAGVVALIIGFLCVRHTEIYFAMLTLAFGMMIHSIIWKWRSVTGGDDGLVGVPRAPLGIPGLLTIDMADLERYYYFVLVLVVLGIFAVWRVVRSSLGLTLQGIRDSESRVTFIGLSVMKYRLIAFTIAGVASGLAGALMVPLGRSASPAIANWTFSAEPVIATLLGGAFTFAGPIVGSFLFYIIKELVVIFTGYWMMTLGIIVLALVLGFRGGVVSVIQHRLLPLLARRHIDQGGDG